MNAHATTRKGLAPGDFVRYLDKYHPMGKVQSVIGRRYVAVKWPSGLWWKHHEDELGKV